MERATKMKQLLCELNIFFKTPQLEDEYAEYTLKGNIGKLCKSTFFEIFHYMFDKVHGNLVSSSVLPHYDLNSEYTPHGG